MSSLFKVPYTEIVEILPHSNADALEVAVIYGFHVIVKKGVYKQGDKVLYIPIDSIIPIWLEERLFPEGSKIKLDKQRVRQIRIRKLVSQGMVLNLEDVTDKIPNPRLEEDYSAVLGIKKYEPVEQGHPSLPKLRNKPLCNPRFHEYNGVDALKWCPNFFKGQEVVIQTKLHGTNARFGCHPTVANTLWKKIKKLLRILPEHEFCYGSNRVELTNRSGYKGYYGTDLYGVAFEKVKAKEKVKPGETVYGEIVGRGIQANYHYGHDEPHFILFDVKVTKEDGSQEYLNPEEAEAYAKERGFDFIPVIYKGMFENANLEELSTGKCDYYPKHVKEGVVVKARNNYSFNGSKKAFKVINPQYLDDRTNSDNH